MEQDTLGCDEHVADIVCSSIPPFLEVAGEDVCLFSLDDPPDHIARKMLDFVEGLKPHKMFRKVIKNYAWDNIYHEKLFPLLTYVVSAYRKA